MPAIRRAYSRGENSFLFSNCEDLLIAFMKEGIKLRIVIDALDECDDPDRLLKALHNIIESAPGQCQLLVSGRPEVQVKRRFADITILDVQKYTTSIDMRSYITKEVKRPDKSERIFGGDREDLEDRLIDILNRKANGMWVYLCTSHDAKLIRSGSNGSACNSESSHPTTKPAQQTWNWI